MSVLAQRALQTVVLCVLCCIMLCCVVSNVAQHALQTVRKTLSASSLSSVNSTPPSTYKIYTSIKQVSFGEQFELHVLKLNPDRV